jgi:hypothetical protein
MEAMRESFVWTQGLTVCGATVLLRYCDYGFNPDIVATIGVDFRVRLPPFGQVLGCERPIPHLVIAVQRSVGQRQAVSAVPR